MRNPYVGGAFGSGLRAQHNVFLAALGAKMLKRSVRITLTRQQMFTHVFRPEAVMDIALGAQPDGTLQSMIVDGVMDTSRFEHNMENLVIWGLINYKCPNATADYKVAPRDTYTSSDMRAPGASTGVNLFEIAVDEMAYACNMDPLAFRLHIATAASDIGTGTYTILAQSASEAFGIPIEMIDIELGDSTLPECPTEGSSWTAASAGAAVWFACQSLREKLFKTLGKSGNISAWLTEGLSNNTTMLQDGFLQDKDADENLRLSLTGQDRLEVEETTKPGLRGTISQMRKARFTHSAVFCEVRVDEELGIVRVTRLVNAVAAGRIMNPKTAASQVRGAMVMATGMALHEESLMDERVGRFMNHNFAEYHIPAHADIPDMDVIFVEEKDQEVSPLGVKGVGEIGMCGTTAKKVSSAVDNHAAIHMQRLARHEGRVLARQIDIGRTKLSRIPTAPHWRILAQIGHGLRINDTPARWLKRRPDRPRRYGIHPDPLRHQLKRKRPRYPHLRRLGRGIGQKRLVPGKRIDGGRVDDGAPLLQMRKRRPDKIEIAVDIGVHMALPFFIRYGFNVFFDNLHTGIVHEDVETAQLIHSAGHGIIADLTGRDITGNGQPLAPFLLNKTNSLLCILMFLQVEDCHIRTFTGKMNGRSTSNPAIATADQGLLSLKLTASAIIRPDMNGPGLHQALEPWLMILGLWKNMIRHETALRNRFWCFPRKTLPPCSTAQTGKCCLTSLRGTVGKHTSSFIRKANKE